MPSLHLLIDTREQQPLAFSRTFTTGQRGWILTTERTTLPTGDYSIPGHAGRPGEIHGITIERKASLDELALCFTSQRERFESEMQRMTAFAVRVLLVIGRRDDIANECYRSRMNPVAFLASLDGWSERFNVPVRFCANRPEAADYVAQACRRYLERFEHELRERRRRIPPPPPLLRSRIATGDIRANA